MQIPLPIAVSQAGPLEKCEGINAFKMFIQRLRLLGGRHSSMVSSAPTILQPWVQIPSTSCTLFSIYIIEIVLRKWTKWGRDLPIFSKKDYVFCTLTSIERWNQCDQKKSPNVYKSSRKMISAEKLLISTPLQKLPKNVGDLGKLIVA